MLSRTCPAFLLAVLFASHSAVAQSNAAIVEEVEAKASGLKVMDYLTVGQRIRLGAGEKVVIGYMKSCWRETVVGGLITIGSEQSEIADGHVVRAKVRCESGGSTTSKQTAVSGAVVFRSGRKAQATRVYSLSPLFVLKGRGPLLLERLDKTESAIKVDATKGEHGSFVDLARKKISLTAGAVYRARAEEMEITVQIDASADEQAPGILERLIHLRPSG